MRASRSVKDSARSGCARPSDPTGIVQTSLRPTVSTRNRPSGDQSLGSHGDFGHAIVRFTPLPSDAAKPIVGLSNVPARYATWVPSGDQTGITSKSADVVSRSVEPRSRSSTQMSGFPRTSIGPTPRQKPAVG